MPASDSITSHVTYRPVPGFPGYRVGDDGSIWSQLRTGKARIRFGEWKELRSKAGDGRPIAALRRDGETFQIRVHQLVLLAFVGPCPPGMEACHWDDDKLNNRLENLRWDTPEGNRLDYLRNSCGIIDDDDETGLNEADVAAVRALRSKGLSRRGIKRCYRLLAEHSRALIQGYPPFKF